MGRFDDDENKMKGIGLDEFWKLVKSLKNESESSWGTFMRNFGMNEKGAMIFKCKTMIPMLSLDFEIRQLDDNTHRIFLKD